MVSVGLHVGLRLAFSTLHYHLSIRHLLFLWIELVGFDGVLEIDN